VARWILLAFAPARPFQRSQAGHDTTRDDGEYVGDDALALARVSAENDVTACALVPRQTSERGAAHRQHAIPLAHRQLFDGDAIFDFGAAGRTPVCAPCGPLQLLSKVAFERASTEDVLREDQPVESNLGPSASVGNHTRRDRRGRGGPGGRVLPEQSDEDRPGNEPGARAEGSPHAVPLSLRDHGWPSLGVRLEEMEEPAPVPPAPRELAVAEADVDVVVIGGGVNGTGVARDCALRGMKVALIERNDIAFGASGNSSGMIHGGPRYLTADPDVTYSSCLDSGHIQRIAPHLLFRIPFLMPVFQSTELMAEAKLAAFDAFFDVYDRYQPLKRGKPHVRLRSDEIRELEPGLSPGARGGITFDEWGIDGTRLCVANAVDAMEHGAEVRVHTTVTHLLRREDGSVTGVGFLDRTTGESGRRTARLVVNATGAWAPITATLGGLPPNAARVRPGKGIHVFLDRRLTNYALLTSAIDNRQVFLLPWQNVSVLGTTDDDYYGDLDRVVATGDEVRYLFQAVARVFPSIWDARAIGTWGGVRPTLYAWGKNEDQLSREHEIVDHAADGADGLYSMLGGKLASYRLFSEEMTDVLARRLRVRVACRTHTSPLPGGDDSVDPMRLVVEAGMEAVTATRLEYRHGGRSLRVMERMLKDPREAAVVCPCEPVTEAEIRYSVAHELAQSVADVSRRTRLGLGVCGGVRCVARCGRIVAEMTGRSPNEGLVSARRFLEDAARKRAPAVGPAQARQEAVTLAALRAHLGSSEAAANASESEDPA
jgi:glycerol-3-phosphate dehydrogenase